MSSNDLNEQVNGLLESALSRFLVKDYSESLNELKSALMLDKANPVLLYNIGICYCRMGLYNSAIQYLNEVIKLPLAYIDANNVKKILAYAMLKSNNYSGAEIILKELQSLIPNDNQVISMFAYAYEKQGRYREAMELYKIIIQNDPDYFSAYNSLAYNMAQLNIDLNNALFMVVKALKNSSKNPAFLDTAGYIYMKMGDIKRAGKCLNEANKLMPLNNDIEGHIRELLALKKNRET